MPDTNLIFNTPLVMCTELNLIQVANNTTADIDYPYEPGSLAVRTCREGKKLNGKLREK
jgi:hypothetical protein